MSKNILVAYFSQSGNTTKLANMILAEVGGALLDIGANPSADLSAYDTIFVGTPNWSATLTPAVKDFLTKHDLSGKTIVPFCTHGMGGLQNIESDMTHLCPNSKMLPAFAIKGVEVDTAPPKVKAWLKEIGLA
jgi:flavodoxin